MKDKKWLKNEIEDMCPLTVNGEEYLDSDRVFELIDQLDDQSRQIDKLANFIMSEVEGEPSQSQSAVDTAIRIIKSYEPQKVVVPKWLDEWYRTVLGPDQEFRYRLREISSIAYGNQPYATVADRLDSSQKKWIKDNIKLVTKALLYGYEVEKEKLYWVRDKNGKSLISRSRIDDKLSTSCGNSLEIQEEEPYRYQFTEEEIKDYDERYVPFMAPVEEVDNE